MVSAPNRYRFGTGRWGAKPIWIEADPVRLAQIISNLVDNAAKYTPEDGHISVAVSSEEHHVLLEVRDTGVGISADQARGIFQPFTQLPGSSESFAGGLGLGLALVLSLTELHGGAVNVVSAGQGQGSCFTVSVAHSTCLADPIQEPGN